jgi:hypothetical protein
MACHCNSGKVNQLAWENQTLRAENERMREVLQLAREASNQDLELSRSTSLPYYLESRFARWIESRIGADHMHSKERAMRNLEESIELAQAEGITQGAVNRQAAHVFARPAGEPRQEAGGVAVTLLGWCAATGNRLLDVLLTELERIEAKPIEEIRGSLARKADDDLVTFSEEK